MSRLGRLRVGQLDSVVLGQHSHTRKVQDRLAHRAHAHVARLDRRELALPRAEARIASRYVDVLAVAADARLAIAALLEDDAAEPDAVATR